MLGRNDRLWQQHYFSNMVRCRQDRGCADTVAAMLALQLEQQSSPSLVAATDASTSNNTALHHAADAAHHIVCKVLLDHDALVDARNDARETPLHVAMARGHIGVCV